MARMSAPRVMASGGFGMIAVLVGLTVANVLLSVAATHWSRLAWREREIEFRWRGEQYARALRCYFKARGTFPEELDDLVQERCIRKLYPDPMTEHGEWQLLRGDDPQSPQSPAGRRKQEKVVGSGLIVGVASKSSREVFSQIEKVKTYRDWQFTVGRTKPRPGIWTLLGAAPPTARNPERPLHEGDRSDGADTRTRAQSSENRRSRQYP